LADNPKAVKFIRPFYYSRVPLIYIDFALE